MSRTIKTLMSCMAVVVCLSCFFVGAADDVVYPSDRYAYEVWGYDNEGEQAAFATNSGNYFRLMASSSVLGSVKAQFRLKEPVSCSPSTFSRLNIQVTAAGAPSEITLSLLSSSGAVLRSGISPGSGASGVYTFTVDAALDSGALGYLQFDFSYSSNQQSTQFTINSFTYSEVGKNQDMIDEDFGYTKPNDDGISGGIEQGNNLLDDMTQGIDDFVASLNSDTAGLIENINNVKPVVDGVFAIIPLPVTICIAGVIVFLVIRKVVGR